jgi:hypothetical protein
MSGPELAREAGASRPRLPVVVISGYAEPEDRAGMAFGRLVRKPLRAGEQSDQSEIAVERARPAPVA